MNEQNQQQFLTQKQNQQKQNREAPPRQNFQFSFSEGDKLDAELRKPRSRAYMEIFDAVDLISATDEEIIAKLQENMDPDTAEEFADMTVEELLEEIRASIQEEFCSVSLEIKQVMHGVLAKCYINGCDCHAISPEGAFMDHYRIDGPMPAELEKGRPLFGRFPNCRCVEVYSDCCRVVLDDASVVTVKNRDL